MRKSSLVAILAAALATSAYAQLSGLEVGVRSGIDVSEKAKRDHDPAYARDESKRLRRYLLASIKEVKTDEKLVRPMDAKAMAQELNKVLQANGFHPVKPGEKPEIIITALYGRGMLINPYVDPDSLPRGDFRHGVRGPQNLSDSIKGTQMVTHDVFVGLEAKTQALNYEKVAIQVSALAYPPPADPKEKPRLLWQSIMYADDADHRDLNLIMPKLLASGAPYFDKPIDREREVKVMTDLPAGHVNVGTPEVVPEKK